MKTLNHLQQLEAESIHIMREVAAGFENPCMFYSIGKDSTVMLHLARKAFAPGKVPFKLLHIDTTWEFAEMATFRDRLVKEHDLDLIVHINESALAEGVHPIESGSVIYNDQMKTIALKQAVDKQSFDAALGGARRDEERSRAKERIFSIRSAGHRWDPKSQRPELWNLYNTRINPKETGLNWISGCISSEKISISFRSILLNPDFHGWMREQGRFWASMMSGYCLISPIQKKPALKNAGYASEHWAAIHRLGRLKVILKRWQTSLLK